MNTFMYTHPITAKQLNIILSPDFGIEVLKPVEKFWFVVILVWEV